MMHVNDALSELKRGYFCYLCHSCPEFPCRYAAAIDLAQSYLVIKIVNNRVKSGPHPVDGV